MKLYKFRPLGSCLDLERAQEILAQGKFWCSPFWELNDPMEGVYRLFQNTRSDSNPGLYEEKSRRVICSFSGECGFSNPALWGYYANGFKGIAIEIEVRDAEVRKVQYACDIPRVMDSGRPEDVVDRILTTKLCCWQHEDEYRYLTKDDRGYHAIGEITGLYFGNPYGNVGNSSDVQRHESIRKYVCRSRLLRKIARKKRIPCKDVHIEGGCVRVGVWPVGSTRTFRAEGAGI